jgi:hypothetical protein
MPIATVGLEQLQHLLICRASSARECICNMIGQVVVTDLHRIWVTEPARQEQSGRPRANAPELGQELACVIQ